MVSVEPICSQPERVLRSSVTGVNPEHATSAVWSSTCPVARPLAEFQRYGAWIRSGKVVHSNSKIDALVQQIAVVKPHASLPTLSTNSTNQSRKTSVLLYCGHVSVAV